MHSEENSHLVLLNIIDILILRLPLVFVKYHSTAGAVAGTTTGNSMRWCVLKRLVFHQEEASYDSDCDANEPDDDDGRFRCSPPHRYRKKKSRGTASLVVFTFFTVMKNVVSEWFSSCMKDLWATQLVAYP